MATVKQTTGTRTSLAIAATTLAGSPSTYVQSTSPWTATTTNNYPVDVIVEVDAYTTNAPSGNKQILVFIRESLDGTNFRSGPTSGSTTTDEPNLRLLGTVPLATASTTEIGTFSVQQALGYVPLQFYIVVRNDAGVALTTPGVTLYTSEVIMTVA